RLRPLHEADPLGREVVVEQAGVLARQRQQAVEVEVRDLQRAALVDVSDREGRAGDRIGHAQRAGGAAHEGGLAAAELAGDQNDAARPKARGQLGTPRLGLLRTARLHAHAWSVTDRRAPTGSWRVARAPRARAPPAPAAPPPAAPAAARSPR